jgi:hypothetical protein
MIPSNPLRVVLPLLLGGCAATSPIAVIDQEHPASSRALEAAPARHRNTLEADAATQKTHALIAQRQEEAEGASSEQPTQPAQMAPKTKPAAGHEHH